MTTLSTTLRCNHCGSKLRSEGVNTCPRCNSDLSRVGVWSELREWGEVRKRGRQRFILIRGVLGCGGLITFGMLLGYCIAHWGFGKGDLFFALGVSVLSVIGGLIFNIWYWQSAEREYVAAMNPEPRPPPP